MSLQCRIIAIVPRACLALALGFAANTLAGDAHNDPLDGLKLPTMLADAHDMTAGAAETGSEEKADNYEVCAAFRADIEGFCATPKLRW